MAKGNDKSIASSIERDLSPLQSPSTPSTPSSSRKKKKKKKKDRPCKEWKNDARETEPRPLDLSPCVHSNNYSSFDLTPVNTRLLTYDFVVRSLRRRLWKAFSEDDAVAALRTYQATLAEFVQWLEQEEEEKLRQQQETESRRRDKSPAAAATATVEMVRSRSFPYRASSSPRFSNLFSSPTHHHRLISADSRSTSQSPDSTHSRKPDKNTRRRRSKKSSATTGANADDRNSHDGNSEYRQVLLRLHQQEKMETESLIGGSNVPILQCKMNPSDAFIADDYLSPYDDATYDHPAQTVLPDPIKHALDQQAIMEDQNRRKRKSRNPRMAFRRFFLGRQEANLNSSATLYVDDHSVQNLDGASNPRSAENFGQNSASSFELSTENDKENKNNHHDEEEEVDATTTTPLHEAARLGAGNLVRLMLANGGNVNAKNEFSRTAIHMCAGGITTQERQLRKAEVDAAREDDQCNKSKKKKSKDNKSSKKKKTSQRISSSAPALAEESASSATPAIGIGASAIPNGSLDLLRQLYFTLGLDSLSDGAKSTNSKNKKMSRSKRKIFGKILSLSSKKERDENKKSTTLQFNDKEFKSVGSLQYPKEPRITTREATGMNPKLLNEIVMDRMDGMLALLSWIDEKSGDRPSVNAVDNHGRTALHYAAEHGRSDICMAILNNFDVMLTIVDDLGTRTPCEVAAAHGHDSLAAQLEARGLLYVDPYGLDDEMLDALTAANETGSTSYVNTRNNPCGRLVAPFRWFITCSKEEVAQERRSRLAEAQEKLQTAIVQEEQESGNTSHTSEELDQKYRATTLALIKNPMYRSVRGLEYLQPYVTNAPTGSTTHANEVKLEACLDTVPSPSNQNLKVQNGQSNCSNTTSVLKLLEYHHLEQYMAHHKWDLPAAISAFQMNQAEALTHAGIEPSLEPAQKILESENETTIDGCEHSDVNLCQICYDDEVAENDWMVLRNCEHGFCKDCLTDYVKDCGNNRMPLHSITCPQHDCESCVSIIDIRGLLERDHPEILCRIEEASTDHFITSHPNFKFCPYPNCTGVVHRLKQPKWPSAGYDETFLNYTGATCVACHDGEKYAGSLSACNELTYEGVVDPEYTNCRSLKQPRKAQRFCFSCGEAVHWPLTCQRLEEWNQRVSDEIGKVDDENGEGTDLNDLAQKLWIKANTRPCPECNAPIEKNDGCNHMVCHACHHEFCWICRKDWKLHSNETGGYFRCNIWKEDDPDRIEDKNDGGSQLDRPVSTSNNPFLLDVLNDQSYGTSIHSARKAWRKKQEMNRFIHHYTRWEAHKESAILEKRMGDSVCTRLALVVEAAIEFNGSPAFNFRGKGLSFLHNAFFELAECRSTLRHSYAFSFFRYPPKSSLRSLESQPIGYLVNKRKEKLRFERLQSELETITEQMSDIVARSHLRATQMQITYLTAAAAEKRTELNNFLFMIFREENRAIATQKRNDIKQTPPANRSHATPTSINGGVNQEQSEVSPEVFSRLLQIRDPNYQPTLTSYVTTTSPSPTTNTPRNLSVQLIAANEQVQAIGESVHQMERLLSQSRNLARETHEANDDRSDHRTSDYPTASQMWGCPRCTFMNTRGSRCAMCGGRQE